MARMIFYFQIAICSLLAIGIIVALVRKYQLTRDIGFVWLGVAIVIWPFAEGQLRFWLTNLSRHHVFDGYTPGNIHSLVSMSLWIIGFLLQLVAILCFYRKKSILSSSIEPH